MRSILILALGAFSLISCNNKETTGYELTGTVKNAPDGSMIYLWTNNELTDSTTVDGGKFEFTGEVDEPTQSAIEIKDSRDYSFFWLENTKMEFTGEAGKFMEGKVTGSQTNDEYQIMSKRMLPSEKKIDSLQTLYSDENTSKAQRDSLLVAYNVEREKGIELEKEFVREYPNSFVSLLALDIYKFSWGKETTEEIYNMMNEERQNSEKGKAIARFIELSVNPKIGEKYVDFAQPNIDGETVRLSNVMKKYTLVDFWASWCIQCRENKLKLIRDYNRFNEMGFEILGVSIDREKDEWARAMVQDNTPWENVSDLNGRENEAAVIYNVSAIPDNILIDEEGTIIARGLFNNELRSKLEELYGLEQTVEVEEEE